MYVTIEEIQKMNLATMKCFPPIRQLTPPESPKSTNDVLLPPIRSDWTEEKPATTGKMSLDFIAPKEPSPTPEVSTTAMLPRLDILSAAAAMRRGSRPTSPLHATASALPIRTHSPHYIRPRPHFRDEYYPPAATAASGLPSPVWSQYSEPLPVRDRHAVHLSLSYQDHRALDSSYFTANGIRSALYTHPGHRPARIQKRSPKAAVAAARAERHPYDPEERYALAYLRRRDVEKKLEWKDVLVRYHELFPIGVPRRYKPRNGPEPRGLPTCYPLRDVQGLQCRYYRIRDEEKMTKMRDDRFASIVDTPDAAEVVTEELAKLDQMAAKYDLDPAFVAKVKLFAQKGDFGEILRYGRARL